MHVLVVKCERHAFHVGVEVCGDGGVGYGGIGREFDDEERSGVGCNAKGREGRCYLKGIRN